MNVLLMPIIVLGRWSNAPSSVVDLPEVLTERASCASTLRNQIMFARLHVGLEAVSTHNLMRMRASDKSWIDKRIETLNCELRTREAHHRRSTSLVLRLYCAQQAQRRNC
jgi:hypothetical protein